MSGSWAFNLRRTKQENYSTAEPEPGRHDNPRDAMANELNEFNVSYRDFLVARL